MLKSLKRQLNNYYNLFDRKNVFPDPIYYLHLLSNPEDKEIMGFIASTFAYGNVKQINNVLKNFLSLADYNPYKYILNFSSRKKFNIRHRFYSESDIKRFFSLLRLTLNKYYSLKNLFLKGFSFSDNNVGRGISNFSFQFLNLYEELYGIPTHGIKFMFPIPERGSACKRMNLFLRWMVRKDDIDLGLWNEIPKNKLIIPVDTHIARISKSLGLTTKKNVSWRMAEEITENLKIFDPLDPVKYDFALCHIGIRKLNL